MSLTISPAVEYRLPAALEPPRFPIAAETYRTVAPAVQPRTISMPIIGISGRKRSGKDTVAAMLMERVAEMGLVPLRRAWADPLKDEVAAMLKPRMAHLDVRAMLDDPDHKEDFRSLLQWWGTTLRRKYSGEDYWLRQMDAFVAKQTTPYVVLFIPDVRFPNEAEWVKSRGGTLIRVERPGLKAVDTHPSETMMDGYTGIDRIIKNDGTLDSLREECAWVASGLASRGFFARRGGS